MQRATAPAPAPAPAQPVAAPADVRPVGPAGRRVAAQCGDAEAEVLRVTIPPPDVRVGQGGWALPASFVAMRQDIRAFPVRASDVFLLGFPKSGTTWTEEMVWLLDNGCDLESARKEDHWRRVHVLERLHRAEWAAHLASLSALPRDRRRYFKSHLPLELLPADTLSAAKVVYVSRDPRDVAVSLFHNYRTMGKYKGSLDDFLEAVVADEVIYAPMLRHVDEFRRLEGRPNVLLLTYEEMKRDLRGVVRRVARFLGVDVVAEDDVLEHLSFGAMKANPAVNLESRMPGGSGADDAFIRRGEAGGWRTALDSEQAAKLEAWCATQCSRV